MNAATSIRKISAAETYPLRLPILRAGLPPESAIFPGDELPTTVHLGSFAGETLTGIVTLLRAPMPGREAVLESWQLRGMATLPEVRGTGHGRRLVLESFRHCHEAGGKLLWCNARTPAGGFYRKLGFEPSGGEFEIPTAGPHIRMWTPLPARLAPYC